MEESTQTQAGPNSSNVEGPCSLHLSPFGKPFYCFPSALSEDFKEIDKYEDIRKI